MKITCQACAAKYTIADDKVQGKIVKIRCKKCGATIVVNGNDPSAAAGHAGEPARFDYAGQSGGEQWTVNVADGDQRTMTDPEIVEAYHSGVVTDETFCWKDGMNDWLPLREIEPLYAQCTSTRVAPPGGVGAMHDPDDDGEGVTKIQDPGGAGMFGGGGVPRPAAGQPAPAANGYADAAPLAARRTGGRAPAADLFGSAAQAGSEEDVMTSAPAGMPQPHAATDDKLTGQRNENSVLFSLNALTSKGGPGGGAGGSSMPAGSEASGLIDIRQLSNQIGLGEDKKKKSRIDDIMNLGGGGAFAPSLGAPVLAAPPIEEYAPPPEDAVVGAAPAAAQSKNRMVILGAVAAGVLVILGAIGVATMMMKGKDETADSKAAASASAAASAASLPSAAPSASVAVAAAATDTSATPSATASAAAAPTDSTASAAPTATATATSTATAKPTPTSTGASTGAPMAAATTAPAATAAPTAAAAAAAGGSDQPFNMGAAKSSLGGIAGAAQACKKGDVTGTGRATVTFNPNGTVQSVAVSGTGFEGTPAGACVASRFRGARVPPFSGSPFSVSKSFTIN